MSCHKTKSSDANLARCITLDYNNDGNLSISDCIYVCGNNVSIFGKTFYFLLYHIKIYYLCRWSVKLRKAHTHTWYSMIARSSRLVPSLRLLSRRWLPSSSWILWFYTLKTVVSPASFIRYSAMSAFETSFLFSSITFNKMFNYRVFTSWVHI